MNFTDENRTLPPWQILLKRQRGSAGKWCVGKTLNGSNAHTFMLILRYVTFLLYIPFRFPTIEE